MTILITGAQFGNKGAQSLLACAVNEIKKRYSSVRILFMPVDSILNYDPLELTVELVYDDGIPKDSDIGIKKVYRYYQHFNKLDQIKNRRMKVFRFSKILPQVDYLIDVSGYSLSTKWPLEINKRLLRYINDAKRYNIPVFLMPQSFGPFNGINRKMISSIKMALQYAKIVFAREEKGKDELKSLIGEIENIEISPDLVLCSEEPKPEMIFNNYNYTNYDIETVDNIGIIPNTQLLLNCDEDSLVNIYKDIINKLLCLKKNIYIFRHSSDLDLCKSIYQQFDDNDNVFLIEKEFDCFEFGRFLRYFDFIIGSRYHAIVHAYKQGVPSIILGWAIKYEELAKRFNQEKFVFEINRNEDENKNIVEAISFMNDNLENQRRVIIDALDECKKHSCMDKIWKYINDMSRSGFDKS